MAITNITIEAVRYIVHWAWPASTPYKSCIISVHSMLQLPFDTQQKTVIIQEEPKI